MGSWAATLFTIDDDIKQMKHMIVDRVRVIYILVEHVVLFNTGDIFHMNLFSNWFARVHFKSKGRLWRRFSDSRWTLADAKCYLGEGRKKTLSGERASLLMVIPAKAVQPALVRYIDNFVLCLVSIKNNISSWSRSTTLSQASVITKHK